jgi:hypothetical protein
VVRRWQLINGEKMHRSCTSELERGGGSWGAVLVGGAQGLYRGRGVVDGEGGGKASIKDC